MSERDRWDIAVPEASELGPWPLLVEVARTLPPRSWTLIGGMMVQLHALRAGIPHPRATTDVDALIHVETGATTYRATAALLTEAGFAEAGALHRGAVQHRFVRGADVVDVLVADHAAPSVLRARAVPTAVQAPGGTRALRNTVDATVTVNGETVELSLPDELGALVLKSSVYATVPLDRDRHLDDLQTLLEAQADPRDVVERCNLASSETRARVSTALHAIRARSSSGTGPGALSPALRYALDVFEYGLTGEPDRARERS